MIACIWEEERLLKFKLGGTQIGLSFSFFALFAVLFYARDSSAVIMALTACLIHEIGHLYFMWIFRCRPESVVFYGGGIRIIPDGSPVSLFQERIILAAGSLFNLASALVLVIAGARTFAAVNAAIGSFNLMPFRNFDGGCLLESFAFTSPGFENIRKLFSLVLAAAGTLILVRFGINLSLAVTVCYIIASEILC